MLVSGIVSEFNPFHRGHAALISSTRKAGATHIVAVMSGNFVQRGEPAILSKWVRTKQALTNGADLVIELPLPWALSGAESFAFGGVFLLDALGVDMLSFGCECGRIDALEKVAEALTSFSFHPAVQKEMKSGATFAKARQNAVSEIDSEASLLLREPNNILAVEYLKALSRLQSKIVPYTIKRIGAAHDAQSAIDEIASASQIRKCMRAGKDFAAWMPETAADIAMHEIESGLAPASIAAAERAVLAKLRSMNRENFTALPDISEGLENRIYDAARKACSLEELYSLIKSKRYTHARIRRIVLSAFLGLDSSLKKGSPPYLRVLGFNQRGTEILHSRKPFAKLPIVTNTSDILSLDNYGKSMLELESRATDLYSLCSPKAVPCGRDRTTGILSIFC